MSKKYYLDTCIWRDYFEDRKDRFRPLGEWAFQFIKKIIEEESKVIFSDLNRTELMLAYSGEEINNILTIIPKSKLIFVERDKGKMKSAKEFSIRFKIHFADALHAVFALENGAILVSRDKHFDNLRFVLDVKKPEDLI